jgi:hypothetical protein
MKEISQGADSGKAKRELKIRSELKIKDKRLKIRRFAKTIRRYLLADFSPANYSTTADNPVGALGAAV